jgi:ATP-dependent DNA helicase RecQ
LLFEGLLREDPNDGRPLLGMGDADAVRAVYRGERCVRLRRAPEAHDAKTRSGRPRKGREAVALDAADQGLFDTLRAWRREEAARQAVPPYVIFHDRTLAEIAAGKPRNPAALARIGGVGQGKLERYGAAVLALVAKGG